MAHLSEPCVFNENISSHLQKVDNNRKSSKVHYPTSNPSVKVISNVLSVDECQTLISNISELGLDPPPYFSKTVRNCTRRHTVDPGMSDIIMPRLKPYLPEIVVMDNVRWKLSRFTHHWRYVKYVPGGKFIPHWDGAKMLPWHEMTVFTVQVYLNDNFEGGSTRFYTNYVANRLPSHDIEYGTGQLKLDESIKPTHKVTAKTGSVLVFNHSGESVLHDGEIVVSGEKYILRGDVLYTAIHEDVPLLKNPSCKTWCENTAKRRGTRNYIGQVWICWCAVDDVGANINQSLCDKCNEITPLDTDKKCEIGKLILNFLGIILSFSFKNLLKASKI